MLLEKGQTLNTIPLERKLDQILLNDRPRAMTWFHLRWVKEPHKWFVFLGGMMESPVSLEDLMRRYREVSDFKRGLAYSRCFVHVCSCLSCFSFFVCLFACLFSSSWDYVFNACPFSWQDRCGLIVPQRFFSSSTTRPDFYQQQTSKTKMQSHEQVFN